MASPSAHEPERSSAFSPPLLTDGAARYGGRSPRSLELPPRERANPAGLAAKRGALGGASRWYAACTAAATIMISRSSILTFSSLCCVAVLALGCSSGVADSAEPEALGSTSEELLSCASVAPWQSGVVYNGGNRVQNGRVVYECKPWPESGWCGQREPGAQFSAWEAAWTRIDSCCGPVINEFTGNYGDGGPNDDFVEISNTCSSNFPTSGLKLVYRSAAGVSDVVLYDLSNLALPANGYVLLTGIQFTGDRTLSSGFFGSNMSATAAGLALRSTNVVYDAVGYGSMTNIYKEGTPATAGPRGESLSRIPNRQDTQNNAADFRSGTPTPGLPNL